LVKGLIAIDRNFFFVGLALDHGKDIVFRFIIEYQSLRVLGP
jgi:hypothetical protein